MLPIADKIRSMRLASAADHVTGRALSLTEEELFASCDVTEEVRVRRCGVRGPEPGNQCLDVLCGQGRK